MIHSIWQNETFYISDEDAEKLDAAGFSVSKELSANLVAGKYSKSLQLFDALFLSFESQLVIFTHNNAPVLISTILEHTVQRDSRFLAKFSVWIYFHRNGFQVRTGINYGVDFTIYRDHPSVRHSEFCVLVSESCASPRLDHLFSLTRIMPDVQKILLLCHCNSSSTDVASLMINVDKDPTKALHDWLGRINMSEPLYLWGPREYASNEQFHSINDYQKRCQSTSRKSNRHRKKEQ